MGIGPLNGMISQSGDRLRKPAREFRELPWTLPIELRSGNQAVTLLHSCDETTSSLAQPGLELRQVRAAQLSTLRFASLLFLLPGLAGMIVSATISSHYAHTLPTLPHPAEMRMVPRNIHGVVVYQTPEEDRKLNLMEYTSVGVFLVGLGMGCLYLSKWGISEALGSSEDDLTPEEISRYG